MIGRGELGIHMEVVVLTLEERPPQSQEEHGLAQAARAVDHAHPLDRIAVDAGSHIELREDGLHAAHWRQHLAPLTKALHVGGYITKGLQALTSLLLCLCHAWHVVLSFLYESFERLLQTRDL